MKEMIESKIAAFNEKVQIDEKMARDLEDIKRVIQIDITDGEGFNFTLEDKQISPILDGLVDNADITIRADRATFEGMLSGNISPMRALLTKKLKLDASFEDILRVKSLLK